MYFGTLQNIRFFNNWLPLFANLSRSQSLSLSFSSHLHLSIPPLSPGEVEKPCVLSLVDDTEHEEEEELRLVLGSPRSESPFGASIGKQNETLVKIMDDTDSKTD